MTASPTRMSDGDECVTGALTFVCRGGMLERWSPKDGSRGRHRWFL